MSATIPTPLGLFAIISFGDLIRGFGDWEGDPPEAAIRIFERTYDGFIENLIQVAIRRVKKPDFPDPYNRSCWVHSTLFDEI